MSRPRIHKVIKEGDKFGKLTILGIDRIEELPSYTARYYKCKCECGLEWIVAEKKIFRLGDRLNICSCDKKNNAFISIINKIKQVMNLENINQTILAKRMGCSKQNIHYLLNNNGFIKRGWYVYDILDKLGYKISFKINKK